MPLLTIIISFFCSLISLVGCQTTLPPSWSDESHHSFRQFKNELVRFDASLDDFGEIGPFAFQLYENKVLRISDDHEVVVDFAKPKATSRAPLVIIAHGNRSAKEAHRNQIEHLASFGMLAIAIQLPNRGAWLENGLVIARLINAIRKHPQLISRRIDTNSIILAGHSFGGSAITIAAGSGAKVKGLILLDPAVFSKRVRRYMRRVRSPTVLLAADRAIYRARRQRMFYSHIQGEFGEISVKNATHDDAQSPSMFAQVALGIDPYTNVEQQRLFTAALTASAFGIAATGNLKWGWQALATETKSGRLMAARYRHIQTASATALASAED